MATIQPLVGIMAGHMLVSIFNDVIGPVMRGPSSSHCAAGLRIGRMARDLIQGTPDSVLFEFDQAGSLPTTHESQGSDMGLFGGLLGWEADDARLPQSKKAIEAAGTKVTFRTINVGDPHPNTYRIHLNKGNSTYSLRAISTGGGMITVIRMNDWSVSLHGDTYATLFEWTDGGATHDMDSLCTNIIQQDMPERLTHPISLQHDGNGSLLLVETFEPLHDKTLKRILVETKPSRHHALNPVLPVLSHRAMRVPFSSAAELMQTEHAGEAPLWKHAVAYEMLRGGISEDAVLQKMKDIVIILRKSVREGVAGTSYSDRVLPAQSPKLAAALQSGHLIGDGLLNDILLSTSAMMEVKSSMGVIVAAPTAGACAALPAAVLSVCDALKKDDDAAAKALLAAGLIGVFIATPWSFAAESGGCQAEGGSAAAMAAAALVGLAGGPTHQSLTAASLALQSMLGLICDPVANRVEVPCLGKNVLAATNALACANMALAGFHHVIPFDEVVLTARTVAEQMPREVKCTALGGLSTTPTSKFIEQQLATAGNSGCDGCSCFQ